MKCFSVAVDGEIIDIDSSLNSRILALEEALVSIEEAVASLQEASGADSSLTKAAIVAVQANIDDAKEWEAAKIAAAEAAEETEEAVTEEAEPTEEATEETDTEESTVIDDSKPPLTIVEG